ncbi:hypothetical protein LPY66_18400 [Dehalobacter sp. DCM]|uniref:hypothetical protein n=1 Tax=Dehalobacter sp. DCM TaxID=2907827 RepID=UPI003081A2C5|nr:hypothetical protein LPY66_18400 [Dehalobacter sp. DCM]
MLILTITASYLFVFGVGRLYQWGKDEERYGKREADRIRCQRKYIEIYNRDGSVTRL